LNDEEAIHLELIARDYEAQRLAEMGYNLEVFDNELLRAKEICRP
jgi:hypothetical protein